MITIDPLASAKISVGLPKTISNPSASSTLDSHVPNTENLIYWDAPGIKFHCELWEGFLFAATYTERKESLVRTWRI
jgi:hypothetical protein